MSVCLSDCLSVHLHNLTTLQLNFTNFFVHVVICYVLPVLWMTLCFHTMGTIGRQTGMALYTRLLVAAGGAQAAVDRLACLLACSLVDRRPRTCDVIWVLGHGSSVDLGAVSAFT